MNQQVKDYTLNFWCILPTFFPQLAPAQNPVAEGLFNLLLAWAALFSGFLPDGRTTRKVRLVNSINRGEVASYSRM